MSTAYKLSNEETKSDNKTDMPVLQEMISDIHESTISTAQTSNTTWPEEDLFIQHAIGLIPIIDNDALSEETDNTNNANDSVNAAAANADNLVGALNSTSKLFSLALNDAATSTIPDAKENSSTTTPVEPIPVQRIDNIPLTPAAPSVQTAASIDPSKKKQHIMISYNRSCENDCRNIRNRLKDLKYKVWMDVYDMHDNFIDGMAKAIGNSYIVLICINRQYGSSFWCKKEIEDAAIKQIKLIPCFMEKPFDLADWLAFLIGGNLWIDFSDFNGFDIAFDKLIDEITSVEKKLATNPRETPPTTPLINPNITILANPTVEQSFDTIMRNFKTWVVDNRDTLKRFDRKQSSQLINQLVQGLHGDSNDENKRQLLQQLLSSTSQEQNQLIPQLFSDTNTSNYPLIKSLFFIMALWAVRVIFKKN